MPLPFKQGRPNLPNNKSRAVHRLICLEQQLRRDQKYCTDYVNFMPDIVARGDAERVPTTGNTTPQKPGSHHSAVASHIYKCTLCRKYREEDPNIKTQTCYIFPDERMEITPAFTHCGVVCFGPHISKCLMPFL